MSGGPSPGSHGLQRALGRAFAGYLKLVRATARIVTEPEDFGGAIERDWPAVVTMWHGEHAMSPFLYAPSREVRILASKSGDGEVASSLAAAFGMGVIRGSGGPAAKSRKRGGAPALRAMLRALEDGAGVALTADMPKTARVVSPGIVLVARLSGRPIIPLAIAANRKIRLANTWDKFTLGLPFSRIAMVAGQPIRVANGEDRDLEGAREELARALDAALARAYDLAHGGRH